MSLVLNEDQQLFRDAAKRFTAERAPVAQLRKLRDDNDATGFSRDLWKEMAGMGWAGVLVPEQHGGVGFGYVGAGLLAEEIGRNLSATPLLSSAVLGVTALLAAGDEARCTELLPQLASGELLVALALDESKRHAPFHVTTSAVAGNSGYVLNGRKTMVLDGHVADLLIISARTVGDGSDRNGITLFIVDPKAQGVNIRREQVVDSRGVAVVELRDVQVNAGSVLGTVGAGAAVLDAVLDAGRVVLAAELLGVAQESFDRTLTYLREREQFGAKIGSFQALQHRAAHLFCEIELTRSVVLRALQAMDARDANRTGLVSLAKARASEVARIATNEAVQMHGGIGVTDEFDIGFFMKRARAAGESFGDAYFHTDRFAQLGGY
jgi:alkylation response protein AidB-like acyl-CoA dehydrogenase